jgi:hypothetical protein
MAGGITSTERAGRNVPIDVQRVRHGELPGRDVNFDPLITYRLSTL